MRKPLDKIVVFIFAIILAGLLITLGPALCDAEEKPLLRTDIKRGLVILTRFPDVKPKINMDEIIRRFQRLDHYVGEMSYGKAAVMVDFAFQSCHSSDKILIFRCVFLDIVDVLRQLFHGRFDFPYLCLCGIFI